MVTGKGGFGEFGRDSLGDDGRGILRELAEKYFEGYFITVEDFPFDLGSVEEEGLATEGIVEGVIGLCLGFLLDKSFSGSATGVVFFGSGLALVFFFPDARIENVESPGEIFYPS
jgi:hypothetical protein